MTGTHGPGNDGKRDCERDGPLHEQGLHQDSPHLSGVSGLPWYADRDLIDPILPQILATVVGGLSRRNVDGDAAFDAFHDAAVRLYTVRPDLKDRLELARWLSRAALEELGKARRHAGLVAEAEAAVVTPLPDPGHVVERRLMLDAVVVASRELRPGDRALVAALIDDLEREPARSTQEATQRRLRLHRMRARLRSRLRDWLVGVPVLRLFGRRSAPPPMAPASAAVGLSLAAVVGVMSVVGLSIRSRSDARADVASYAESEAVPAIGLVAVASTAPLPSPWPADIVGQAASAGDVPAEGQGNPAASRPERIVVAPLPGSPTAAGAGGREKGDDSLICYGNVPFLGDRCVEHPIGEPLPGL